jgi:hypothetical protein
MLRLLIILTCGALLHAWITLPTQAICATDGTLHLDVDPLQQAVLVEHMVARGYHVLLLATVVFAVEDRVEADVTLLSMPETLLDIERRCCIAACIACHKSAVV